MKRGTVCHRRFGVVVLLSGYFVPILDEIDFRHVVNDQHHTSYSFLMLFGVLWFVTKAQQLIVPRTELVIDFILGVIAVKTGNKTYSLLDLSRKTNNASPNSIKVVYLYHYLQPWNSQPQPAKTYSTWIKSTRPSVSITHHLSPWFTFPKKFRSLYHTIQVKNQ